MIEIKKVQQIAKLARLGLSQAEIGKYQKELSKILDYIEKLKEVDISKVEPTSHSIKLENVMRDDKGQKPKLKNQRLLELAPEKKNNYLKVKRII